MSLNRLISWYATLGGVSALAGWGVSEWLATGGGVGGGWFGAPLTCGLVGAAAGAGLTLAAGLADPRWKRLAKGAIPGLIVGGLSGAAGGSLGNVFLGVFHRDLALGWVVMGAGIGAAEGLYERSPAKLREGAIGGSLGGLAGGLLFGPVHWMTSHVSEVGGRASAFVVLGACVGATLGLVRARSAGAWLTVLDRYRPGRMLLLSASTSVIGRAGHAALSLTAQGAAGVDTEHALIVRQTDGRFALEDNHSRHGTSVNDARVLDRVVLGDGDVIAIGGNLIRFSQRRRPPKPAEAPATPTRKEPVPAAAAAAFEPVPVAAPKPPRPAKPAGGLPRGMSRCPKCQRPVAGERPYCVACKLSF